MFMLFFFTFTESKPRNVRHWLLKAEIVINYYYIRENCEAIECSAVRLQGSNQTQTN